MKNQTQHSILLLFPIHHFVFQMNKDNVMLYFRFVICLLTIDTIIIVVDLNLGQTLSPCTATREFFLCALGS